MDTFSPLAPVQGPSTKKLAVSSTVDGGQYDTWYEVCGIRVAIAWGIHGGQKLG